MPPSLSLSLSPHASPWALSNSENVFDAGFVRGCGAVLYEGVIMNARVRSGTFEKSCLYVDKVLVSVAVTVRRRITQ